MVLHYEYCPLCGRKLSLRSTSEDGLVPYCGSCNKMWYDSFPSAVIVLTHNEYNEVVMTRQSHLTSRHWMYNSGFILPGENAEHAAAREIREELGIEIQSLESLGTYWFRGGVLMIAYLAFCPKCEFRLSDEVEEAVWVDVKKAAELAGPVRAGCADFAMMVDYVKKFDLCDPDELWPGQTIERPARISDLIQ